MMNERRQLNEIISSTKEHMLDIRINNHFLFNTLNAISSLAVAENAFGTYESILMLSKLFRYALNSDDRKVFLEDEFAYQKDYLDLQKLRFGDNLMFTIEAENSVKKCPVPFHWLQPIVENAFVHGFKRSPGPHILRLTGKRTERGVLVRVADNGSGMTRDRLTHLRETIRREESSAQDGLVMSCVKLRTFYDAPVAFRIKSAPDEGATVEITLPFSAG
jgi:sensor histidine kinase YesM